VEIKTESSIPIPKSRLHGRREENRRAIRDALLKIKPGGESFTVLVPTHYLLQESQEVAKEVGLKVVSWRVDKTSQERRIWLVEEAEPKRMRLQQLRSARAR
jgi:hypothetical protein